MGISSPCRILVAEQSLFFSFFFFPPLPNPAASSFFYIIMTQMSLTELFCLFKYTPFCILHLIAAVMVKRFHCCLFKSFFDGRMSRLSLNLAVYLRCTDHWIQDKQASKQRNKQPTKKHTKNKQTNKINVMTTSTLFFSSDRKQRNSIYMYIYINEYMNNCNYDSGTFRL